MPVDHYENFPVASLLLPRRLRRGVEAIYWFARSADDVADEGEHPAAWRLAALDDYRRALDAIECGTRPAEPAWTKFAAAIAEFKLPLAPFHDLLSAFAQDVTTRRYPSYAEVHDYCGRSANPVGRLMLHLFGQTSARAIEASDAICTGLQLLNFCQDAALDWRKDRIYFPVDEMRAMHVTEAHFERGIVDEPWRRLFDLQLGRARNSVAAGAALPGMLRGRARLELRAIVAGGERIGARLAATGGDVFNRRPLLGAADWLLIALRTANLLQPPAGAPTATAAPS